MEESTTGTFSGPSSDSVTELTLPAGLMLGLRERVAMADLAEFFDRAMRPWQSTPAVTVFVCSRGPTW